MSQDFNTLNSIFENYEKFKESSLMQRRFKHAEVVPLINKLKKHNLFSVELIYVPDKYSKYLVHKLSIAKSSFYNDCMLFYLLLLIDDSCIFLKLLLNYLSLITYLKKGINCISGAL